MGDRWQETRVFVRVAEAGSFSAAARELGLSQPSVSRVITDLEARLGLTLLLRTTRSLTLTAAGAVFLERARQALADLEEAEQAARGIDSLNGTIRLAVPIVYGTKAVVPALRAFLDRHPDLRVDIIMRDDRQDLIATGVDLAIRMGALEDSTFGSRLIARVDRMLVAAPAYLDLRGVPKDHLDLAEHDAILHERTSTQRGIWTLSRDGASHTVRMRGKVRIDAAPGIHAAALSGLGIANVTTLMSLEDLTAGRLVRLLPDYALEPLAAHAVFPSGPHPSAKVRALVTHLIGALGGEPEGRG